MRTEKGVNRVGGWNDREKRAWISVSEEWGVRSEHEGVWSEVCGVINEG